MAAVVAEVFGILGLERLPPETLGELIPYLLTVLVGVALVSGVFRVVGALADALLGFWRWR